MRGERSGLTLPNLQIIELLKTKKFYLAISVTHIYQQITFNKNYECAELSSRLINETHLCAHQF